MSIKNKKGLSPNNQTKGKEIDNKAKSKGENSDTGEEILRDFLKENSNPDSQPKPKSQKSLDELLADMRLARQQAYNEVMLTALKPELVNNEIQKRTFKEELMKYIKGILIAQISLLGVIILVCCFAVSFDIPFMKEIDNETIKMMFDFLKYYITAIIAEFIAMLFFIVKFVFDKSIVDLIKQLFKNED